MARSRPSRTARSSASSPIRCSAVNAGPGLRVGEREHQLLARHAQLARRAVERGQRDPLQELIVVLQPLAGRGSQGSATSSGS